MNTTRYFDVFLSYGSPDGVAVERLAEKLSSVGLKPWLDKWCLTAGHNPQDQQAEGIDVSASFAVFIGSHGLSDAARSELGLALDRAATDRTFRVFLVLLPGVPEGFDLTVLPPALSTGTWVDLRQGIEDPQGFQHLVEAIRGSERTSTGPVRGAPSGTGSEVEPDPVLLGASSPVAVRPGDEFTARFVAYAKGLESQVRKTLADLSTRERIHLGLQECRWKPGTRVTVLLSGQHVAVEESRHTFEWNGTFQLHDFDVTVRPDAPEVTVVLKYDIYVDEIRLAKLRVDLLLSRTAATQRLRTAESEAALSAFASYASADRLRVLDRVAAVRASAGLEVFLDCLSLHPGEEWKLRLQEEIAGRDVFLLFWSKNAMQSPWVEWEWKTALLKKGEDSFQLQPLDMVDDAPPPQELRHLHFNDPLMVMRRAYENRGQP